MICCHVDDFYWGGNQLFKVEVIDLIKKKFEISKEYGICVQLTWFKHQLTSS